MTSPFASILVENGTSNIRYVASQHTFQTWGTNIGGSAFSSVADSSSNVTVMSIRGSNVGIGTTNPVTALQVRCSATAGNGGNIAEFRNISHAERIAIIDEVSTGTTKPPGVVSPIAALGLGLYARYNGGTQPPIIFYQGNGDEERMRIASGGAVGVGTTNPQSQLHVHASNTTCGLVVNQMGAGSLLDIQDSGVSKMFINAYGNVGIGGTLPQYNFDFLQSRVALCGNLTNASTRPALSTSCIAGELHAYSASGASYDDGFMRLSAGGGTSTGQKTFIDLSGYSTVAEMNANIVLGTAGVERMRIVSSGNVAIGTTDPGANKMYVNGSTFVNGNLSIPRSGAAIYCRIIYNANTANSQQYTLYTNDGDSAFYVASSSGTGVFVRFNGTAWEGYSDRRLKKGIVPLSSMTAKVMRLEPVQYFWKNEEETAENVKYGLIAQDVQEIFPELVHTMSGDDQLPNKLALGLTDFVPLLIQTVKEQQTVITDLQARVQVLESQLQTILARLSQ